MISSILQSSLTQEDQPILLLMTHNYNFSQQVTENLSISLKGQSDTKLENN